MHSTLPLCQKSTCKHQQEGLGLFAHRVAAMNYTVVAVSAHRVGVVTGQNELRWCRKGHTRQSKLQDSKAAAIFSAKFRRFLLS